MMLRLSRRFLFDAAVLTLLGTMCALIVGSMDGAYGERISSETEESKELSEQDDVEDGFAVVGIQVSLVRGHCIDEWLTTDRCRPQISHRRCRCSRGPPAV